LRKIIHAGVSSSSYHAASADLAELSGLVIGPKVVERQVHRIGRERVDQRDAAVAAHQALPLMKRDAKAVPNRPAPAVAMVSVDGGRLQVRRRSTPEAAPARKSNRSVDERSSCWRESKTAVLETYTGESHAADPDPDVPRCFLDLTRTTKMIRGMSHPLPTGLDLADDDAAAASITPRRKGRTRKKRPGRPKRLVRSILASRAGTEDFGPMMHQAAWERNFFAAGERVFLGDGAAANWGIHRRCFSTFTPVLDFVHALCYIFAAAFADRDPVEGEAVYRRWLQAAWSGAVASILPELEGRAAELGAPPDGCGETDPRSLVASALGYLRNNADRMHYDAYRRDGLPIMTSAVESAIKMINRRVKGSEKFWTEPGAEAILQLRADFLSETETLEKFWARREADATGFRPYRKSA
jgi:hypothetical protein